jgi:citrate synthase
LDYVENFLHMMVGDMGHSEELLKVKAGVLDNLLIIHADHEQNCSTSTVRMVSSSGANPYAAVAGGLAALWGPLHGGANEAVMKMLENIQAEGGDIAKTMARAKDKSDPFRLMGFGHRVYKTYDPRAKIAKKGCKDLLELLDVNEPLIDIAMRLEEAGLSDEYFVKRNLYPNVDFYTGIIYRALGLPNELFTVLFAIGRMPGWIANLVELQQDPDKRIGRPRQIYTGPTLRPFNP